MEPGEIEAILDSQDFDSLDPQSQVNHSTLRGLLSLIDMLNLMKLDIMVLRERITTLEHELEEAKGGTDAATT